MSKSPYIRPKLHQLENMKEGQAFSHELAALRDWEKALDAIHILLSSQWYYILAITNTRKTKFGSRVLKGQVCMSRQQQEIPEELETLLTMRLSSFKGLKSKIRERVLDSGNNKDVWIFKTTWQEFPKGTKIIEIYQQPLRNSFLTVPIYRRGFIVLDGRSSTREVNDTMVDMKRVFLSKSFTNRIIAGGADILRNKQIIHSVVEKNVPALEEKSAKQGSIRIGKIRGRMPGGLVMQLLDDFEEVYTTVTVAELGLIYDYLDELKKRGERAYWHEDLLEKLEASYSRANVERRIQEEGLQ